MSFLESSLLADSISTVENIFDYIEKTLEEPEDVYNKLDEMKQKQKLKDIKPILEIVENYIMKRKGVLYGGTALNMLLPKDLKFYGPYEIPDYDFFYPKAGDLAKEIADELYSKGYKYTEVKNALHEGTFKVYCNFESVADVTELPVPNHDILVRNAKTITVRGRTMRISPINFLKAMAYKELCMPISSGFRWSKVYRRLILLEKTYPLTVRLSKRFTGTCDDIFADDIISAGYAPVERLVRHFVNRNGHAHIGSEAIYHYLKNYMDCTVYEKSTKRVKFLSKNLKQTTSELVKVLKRELSTDGYRFKVMHYDELSMFLPKKQQIFVKLPGANEFEKMVSIYDASDTCYSIVHGESSDGDTDHSTLVCSIFFLYFVMYLKILFMPKEDALKSKILRLTLIKLGETLVNNEEEELFNTFTTECYGVEKGMTAVKKSIWDKKKKVMFYRPGE